MALDVVLGGHFTTLNFVPAIKLDAPLGERIVGESVDSWCEPRSQ